MNKIEFFMQGRIQDFAKGGAPVHAKHANVNNY